MSTIIKYDADRRAWGSPQKVTAKAAGQIYEPRREQRADVLKIMRRMHQRIADGRWSGVPT